MARKTYKQKGDEFRTTLVRLINKYTAAENCTRAGSGIRPENQDAKIANQTSAHILQLYDDIYGRSNAA